VGHGHTSSVFVLVYQKSSVSDGFVIDERNILQNFYSLYRPNSEMAQKWHSAADDWEMKICYA